MLTYWQAHMVHKHFKIFVSQVFVLQLITANKAHISSRNKILFLSSIVHVHQLIQFFSLSIFMLYENIGSKSISFLKLITFAPNPSKSGSGASSAKGYPMNQQKFPQSMVLDMSSLRRLKSPYNPCLIYIKSPHTRKIPFLYMLGNSGISLQFPCHAQELKHGHTDISHFSLVI